MKKGLGRVKTNIRLMGCHGMFRMERVSGIRNVALSKGLQGVT